jgi:hypothetical protein
VSDTEEAQETRGENLMLGRLLKQFACRYFYEDSWWGINLSAYDWADAEARATTLGIQLDGEIGAIDPAFEGAGVCVRLWTILRNITRSRGQ